MRLWAVWRLWAAMALVLLASSSIPSMVAGARTANRTLSRLAWTPRRELGDVVPLRTLGRGLLKSKKKKHGGDASSLARRLAYKRGEFNLRRYPQEKLYPSSSAGQPMFPGLPNLAIMKRVVQSSYQPGNVPLAAVDGDQYAFYEESRSHGATKLERNPWIHVDLSDKPVSITYVEVWFPVRKCETYLKNLSLSEKDKWLAAVKAGTTHKLPWKCRPEGRRKGLYYHPSRVAPLELVLKVGEEVVARKTFTRPTSVVHWAVETEVAEGKGKEKGKGVGATSVLVRVKGNAQLSVAEIKIFGARGSVPCGLATCRHGSCKRSGRCECHKDWIGQDCSVNVRGNVKYLPEGPDGSWWDERRTRSFNETYERIQGEDHCEGSLSPHLLPGPAGLGAGLGSTMYYRAGDLTLAMKAGRGYNFAGHFNYARNSYCKGKGKFGDFSCYFRENPRCDGFVEKKRRGIKFPALTQKNAKGQDCLLPHQECKMRENFNEVPEKWQSKDIFWWRTHQISKLFRLNDEAAQIVDLEGIKERIGFRHPIIGVHMRSGDGCRHGVRSRLFDCRTLREYLPEVNALSAKYGTKNVFVATDNPEILAEIELTRKHTDLNFLVVPSESRAQLKSDTKIEQRMTGEDDGFDSHAAIVTAFQDIFLLSECDYLVTHQASTMSRVALNLATMRMKAVPPYISLDGPWCPQWRMCCEPRHDDGRFLVC